MVGTAVYQVAAATWADFQNEDAAKRASGGRMTAPAVDKGVSVAAMRPCTWKRGMARRDLSADVSSYVDAMLASETQRFACVNGTPFGREVVPEVCRNSARVSGVGACGGAGVC